MGERDGERERGDIEKTERKRGEREMERGCNMKGVTKIELKKKYQNV